MLLKQIRYFVTVVECGSFTEAAEKCFISQSAISQQIQALEKELGVTLLRRENRKFTLTCAGEHFYRRSVLLAAELDKLCQETRRIDKGGDYILRVAYLKGYGGVEFQQATAKFVARHPDIRVDVKSGNHEDLYDLIRNERVDLVLNDQRRAFSDEYVNEVLTTIGCRIEIGARNPIARLEQVNVDDLDNVPCILISSNEQRDTEARYYREIYGIRSTFVFAENLEEARLMVLGGRGFLPVEGGVPPAQYGEAIACRPLCRKGKPIQRNYCAFWRVDNSGYYVEEFAEILKKEFC